MLTCCSEELTFRRGLRSLPAFSGRDWTFGKVDRMSQGPSPKEGVSKKDLLDGCALDCTPTPA